MCREFYETKKIFSNHIQYSRPYTFNEWNALPNDKKAAALYVQFFNEVLSAYYSHKLPTATDEECVETVLQYLLKNVPIIEREPKRFTPAYIYKVCANCIACVAYGQVDKDRYYKTMSNVVYEDGNELNLFDTIEDESTSDCYNIDDRIDRAEFWAVIEDMGIDTKRVAEYLISGVSLPRGFRKTKRDEIISKLKIELSRFRDKYYD